MIPKRATKYVFPTVRVITQWILVLLVGFLKNSHTAGHKTIPE
jgi:hypothetical protein